jgi:hypothetical protein
LEKTAEILLSADDCGWSLIESNGFPLNCETNSNVKNSVLDPTAYDEVSNRLDRQRSEGDWGVVTSIYLADSIELCEMGHAVENLSMLLITPLRNRLPRKSFCCAIVMDSHDEGENGFEDCIPFRAAARGSDCAPRRGEYQRWLSFFSKLW